MPKYGLKGIYAAKYVNTNGTVTYTDVTKVGDAMQVNLELRNAEGRLYAEDALAEYMRALTGGTISLGVKYIPDAAQKLLFGLHEKTRSVTYTPVGSSSTATTTATSHSIGSSDEGVYVGVAFYAPSLVDSNKKYDCVFIKKAMFGPPSMSIQTKGENITFDTPTTTGEFLASDDASHEFYEVFVADDENEAKAWVQAVFS